MAETFTFELVSPEKLLFSKAVTMVTVPGGMGEYGVLVGHAPMITDLVPGVIRIYEEEGKVASRLFVKGGFAEVNQTRFTVLASEATPVTAQSLDELKAKAKELSEKIDAATTDEERDALCAQKDVILDMLRGAA